MTTAVREKRWDLAENLSRHAALTAKGEDMSAAAPLQPAVSNGHQPFEPETQTQTPSPGTEQPHEEAEGRKQPAAVVEPAASSCNNRDVAAATAVAGETAESPGDSSSSSSSSTASNLAVLPEQQQQQQHKSAQQPPLTAAGAAATDATDGRGRRQPLGELSDKNDGEAGGGGGGGGGGGDAPPRGIRDFVLTKERVAAVQLYLRESDPLFIRANLNKLREGTLKPFVVGDTVKAARRCGRGCVLCVFSGGGGGGGRGGVCRGVVLGYRTNSGLGVCRTVVRFGSPRVVGGLRRTGSLVCSVSVPARCRPLVGWLVGWLACGLTTTMRATAQSCGSYTAVAPLERSVHL